MAMKLHVSAFPDLGSNSEWINEFRLRHDPLAQLVKPHMTLVFPTVRLSAEEVQAEISSLVKGLSSFRVVLRSAYLMPDSADPKNFAHIFLVPDEGFGDVLRLREKLYSQKLASELRLDIAFVPHMTIGARIEIRKAKDLVDELNSKRIQVEFNFNELSIVGIENPEGERLILGKIKF